MGSDSLTEPIRLTSLKSIPGCILLDVRIPGLSGPELQERLTERGSTLPIIFLTGYPDVRTTVGTVKAGAEDFLTKPVSSDKLLQAVERAIARHDVTYRLKSTLDVVRSRIAALTPREREVFLLIVRGNTNKKIARALGGTERTIKAHRQRVMEKMQVRSVAELVSLAERVGVLASAIGQTPWASSTGGCRRARAAVRRRAEMHRSCSFQHRHLPIADCLAGLPEQKSGDIRQLF